MGKLLLASVAFLGIATMAAKLQAADFALRDGDTVVFLGDSITAARTYSKIIETYTALRFPQRKVKFINRGIGGDTAQGALTRLERDVFAHHASVLVVMFGVNDIGWGLKADEEHRRKYLDAIGRIVDLCHEHKVRVFVCSACVTAEDPERSETGFLKKMCDAGMALSRGKGGESIDVQGSMREIQRRIARANERLQKPEDKKTTLHVADGVHLNDLGQLAVAFALLKGFNAPADVSRVVLEVDRTNPRGVQLSESQGCEVTDLSRDDSSIAFTRLDQGLPFNYGLFYGLNYVFIPVPEQLNRYLLTVRNLPEGKWALAVDGRAVGTFSASHWAQGVNLASATADAWQPGGPWDVQATFVKSFTEARHEVDLASLLSQGYMPDAELTRALVSESVAADLEIASLQRRAAEPRPYRFVLRPAAAKPAP